MNTPTPTTGAIRPNPTQEARQKPGNAQTGAGVIDAQATRLALAMALEMAREVHAASERYSALAFQIEKQLRPADRHSDSPEPTAWRLAEVLDQLLNDISQPLRLIAALEGLCQAMEVDHG